MHAKKSKSNMNQVVYAKMSHQKLPTCFYCGLHGHTSISCNVRMHGIRSGQYLWIQKGQVPLVTNKKGPNITWVPKTCKCAYGHTNIKLYLQRGCSRHMRGEKIKLH
ncbi:hypothetical protein Lal_00039343 [Lupinus albus]|nr:hypothetical protein Lal_00039343 [Lupinus albus]